MTVRRASQADIPALVRMASVEHSRSRFAAQPFDQNRVAISFDNVARGLTSAVFISERGFIAGMVQPNLMNRFSTAYELAWYAEDGKGLQLLRTFIAWARSMRAVEVIAHNYAGIADPARFTRAMKRAGFAELGTSYALTLEN